MARRQGGTLSGFTPLSTPNAPTDLSVSTSIGSASVSFTAPTDTGDGAVTSYIVTAIDESTGVSTGATGSASPIKISGIGGQTVKIRAQAVNNFGPGRLTEFDTGNAILSGAELYAWGQNVTGELGLNNTTLRSSPVQVGALTNWLQIDSGSESNVAVKTDGTLWTWGKNNSGQLGDNTTVNRSSPIQVGALTDWDQVSAGNSVTGAITTGGKLYMWGLNNQGQLGQNTNVFSSVSSPTQVGALTNWSQVSAAGDHTLAVKTDGTLWAWGSGAAGRLGDNSIVNKSSPVQIGALTDWAQVSVGGTHSTALTTSGKIYAWGTNSSGQLGDGTVVNKSSPVQVGALTGWAQVSAGGDSSFAVKTNGTLWAWGGNGSGQLGDNTVGNYNRKSSPIQIGALTNWSQVSGSSSPHAVKTDGTLWAWGANNYGQLGNNTIVNKSSPIQVGAVTDWIQVSSGFNTLGLIGVV